SMVTAIIIRLHCTAVLYSILAGYAFPCYFLPFNQTSKLDSSPFQETSHYLTFHITLFPIIEIIPYIIIHFIYFCQFRVASMLGIAGVD
ncbi:hypothetical protein ACJX0J_007927, partial [Zea mays]